MSIDFTPLAVYDLDTTSEYLENGQPGGGSGFRANLAKLLEQLERFPESGALYEPPSPRYPGLRVAQLSKFRRYAVYYRPTTAGLLVVRCLNSSRNIGAIFGPDD